MAWKHVSAAPKASAQAYPAMPAKPVPEDQAARQGWSGGPAEAEDPQWILWDLTVILWDLMGVYGDFIGIQWEFMVILLGFNGIFWWFNGI